MKKITMYLGLNDKDSKLQNYGTVEAYKICMNLVWDFFGGGTISEWQWFFKHEDGQIVIEKSLIITTMTDKNHKDFVENLKKVFNQESIMVEINSPAISFE